MRKIKINLDREAHLVLTDDDSRVIAIIRVPSGEQDITRKVLGAIEDDTLNKNLKLEYGTTTDPNDFLKEIPVTGDLLIGQSSLSGSIDFDVEMEDEEDDEKFTLGFSLEKTEIY